jgi:hypothetical protein
MLKRFRRGRLDASVFTAATRHAIWRGPSIDDPDSTPTILASRPIRCETYSACIREARPGAAEDGFPFINSADAEQRQADGGATTADAQDGQSPHVPQDGQSPRVPPAGTPLSVLEHIIYFTQGKAGEAEAVPVPAQLTSCEAMWTMPPSARCSCMLRALSRACRGDHMMASLDAASVITLGPLALVLLSARFIRRHGLAPRAVALVMLCQGLVMAWLAGTRQRLPAELRRRPRGGSRAAPLHAAHFASLYTRVSADLAVFNSACGEALPLRGPWEGFDGILFEGMLQSAASAGTASQNALGAASCWPKLLRGDEKLVAIFELLRPLALGTEMESVPSVAVPRGLDHGQPADLVRAAAAAWQDAVRA